MIFLPRVDNDQERIVDLIPKSIRAVSEVGEVTTLAHVENEARVLLMI
jgi:hypothetical protein